MLRNKINTVNTTKSIWHLHLHFPISSIHWNDYDWQVFISEVSLNDFLYDKQCYNIMHVEDFLDSLPSLSSASAPVLCLVPFFGPGTAHTEKYINITHIWSVKVGFVIYLTLNVLDVLPCLEPPTRPFPRPLTCASSFAFCMKKTWLL